MLEVGIFSFGDIHPHPVTGERTTARQNLKDLLERIVLADAVGVDFYGVGEHHTENHSVSACSTVLAAAAQATERIQLGTATISLAPEDPVRLYEQFATLDLLSDGRVEVGLGSGGFVEPYVLFGVDYRRRSELGREKTELFLQINRNDVVTYLGDARPPLVNARIWPRPTRPLDVWLAITPNRESFLRAAKLGVSVQTAAFGGDLLELKDLVAEYREAAAAHGWPPAQTRVAIGGNGIFGTQGRDYADLFYPHYATYLGHVRRSAGRNPTRAEFDEAARSLDSGVFVGEPGWIAEKLRHQHDIVGHDRQILQIDWRNVPQSYQLETVEALGGKVLPELA